MDSSGSESCALTLEVPHWAKAAQGVVPKTYGFRGQCKVNIPYVDCLGWGLGIR